ncbi:Kdo domain containing protein [Flavobacterium sp. Sd200]|uniref:Kdo domain containing protein n=1 Tax=Flavobacterium sp. Sd200 TaxID=2692211 RepID=UPI00136B944B|nr:Kdo domain containing protein [Flavobacterium sp. Sd200]MXN91929.1 Kdo domain containing protein [Flavobacterium sp. Sd200]
MQFRIHPDFKNITQSLISVIDNFKEQGKDFVIGTRNIIKEFEVEGNNVIVKSFKIPNALNRIIYSYFRKSKARRSYEYAIKLQEKGIGTPQPYAYFENRDAFGLKDSYYISEHLFADLTFRELVEVPDFPEHDIILRQFTHFCYILHEKGIEFTDHSPGNTLIKKTAPGQYNFYLVDLNRMNFHEHMNFDLRMENLKKLTPKEEMVAVISNEYAKYYNKPEQEIFKTLWDKTSEFQRKFWRKRALKKKLKFKKP